MSKRSSGIIGDRLLAILAKCVEDFIATNLLLHLLETNHLVEVERVMDISSRLVVNPASLKLKREPLRALIDATLTKVALRSSAKVRSSSAPEVKKMREVGSALFEQAITGQVREFYYKCQGQVNNYR